MSQQSEPPVFFDQSGWRTIIVTAASWAALSIVGVLVATLVATAIEAPVFERLKMSHATRSLSSAPTSGSSGTHEPHVRRFHPRTASAASASNALRLAHLVSWDAKSFASLKRNAAGLDIVVAEWLATTSPSGEITLVDADHTKAVSRWVTQNAPALQIYVQVNNYNRDTLALAGAETDAMLASSEARIRFVSQLTAYAAERQLPGVVLDFEGIDVSSRQNYVTLATELKQVLRERGIKLVIQVGVLNAAFDYAGLAEVADALIVMTYDEHVEVGGAGPLAGQGWFEAQLREVARIVDPCVSIFWFKVIGR
jgi:spore germination protein YaaH